MIDGFFKVVQNDVNLMINATEKCLAGNTVNPKVQNAAMRSLGALGMAFAGVKALAALTMSSTGAGVVIGLAGAALYYALSHDLFVHYRNVDRHPITTGASFISGLASDVKDVFNGKKDGSSAPRHPYNEGTFFQPIWDRIQWEYLKH